MKSLIQSKPSNFVITRATVVILIFIVGITLLLLPSLVWSQAPVTKHPTPVLEVGPSGSWDDQYLIEPYVLRVDGEYKMWYGGKDGAITRIGLATSPDGVVWTKHAQNPVLDVGDTGSWDGAHVTGSSVVFDDSTYQMWYHGHNGTFFQIGYATSPDGVVWTKNDQNPILGRGPSGSWDDQHVETPVVIMLDDTTFYMWYGGKDGSTWRIGLATSKDGVAWDKLETNPVMDVGDGWESDGIFPGAVRDDDQFRMWYFGEQDGTIRTGFATSVDSGVTWTKYGGSPVLDVGTDGDWDDATVAVGAVLFDNSRSTGGPDYELWYDNWDGASGSIGFATAEYDETLDVSTVGEVVPEKYVLRQNYPNPFNPSTKITYTLPQSGRVSLVIYDLHGREVARLVDAPQRKGYHRVSWNGLTTGGQGAPSGIYIARLVTPEHTRSIKMVLLK